MTKRPYRKAKNAVERHNEINRTKLPSILRFRHAAGWLCLACAARVIGLLVLWNGIAGGVRDLGAINIKFASGVTMTNAAREILMPRASWRPAANFPFPGIRSRYSLSLSPPSPPIAPSSSRPETPQGRAATWTEAKSSRAKSDGARGGDPEGEGYEK